MYLICASPEWEFSLFLISLSKRNFKLRGIAFFTFSLLDINAQIFQLRARDQS